MKSISILSKGKKNNNQDNKSPDQQFKYSNSIIPTNFVNLSEENQVQKLGQFNDILRVIEDRIKITMSRRLVAITVEGQITVPYIHRSTTEDPDKLTTATYQFTTGNISEPKEPFSILLSANRFASGEAIDYLIEPENPVPLNMKHTLISRITNPDGIVFSLPKNSMGNLDDYINEISSLHSGNYDITMTVGNFTTSEKFEFIEE